MAKPNSNQSSRIYYDMQITNFQSSTTESPHLSFSESRTVPILMKANDYYLSIVRFQLDTYSLPTFIADIEPNQADTNKMIETVSLEYQDSSGNITCTNPLNLSWIPTNMNINTPAPPSSQSDGIQSNYTQYYQGNSFRHYIDLINNALATQTTNLIALTGSTLLTLTAPFLKWNDDTLCAELYCDELYYNWSRANHVNVYFNRALFAKLNSMPAIRYGVSATLGRFYKMYVKDDRKTRLVVIDSVTYIKTPQEYSTISNWTPVAGIVFVSNTLPVVSNQMSAPVVFNDNHLIKSGITPNFTNIISDMASNEMVYKPNLIYTPTGEYRRVDLRTDQPITELSIQVYWKDRKGNLNPFVLLSGASGSIKIMFEKKV
jgi:hypothetical protein